MLLEIHMPKSGDVDKTYPELLEKENKIKLLESFKGAKMHHKMQCLVCNHIWNATPISKRQTYKKNRVGGCPKCDKVKRKTATDQIQQKHIEELKKRGLIILSDFSALRTTTQKLKFKNINCGHEFETYPGNVIELNTSCIVCGKKDRAAPLTAWSKANSQKWKETASEWRVYKAIVTSLTEQTYKTYKHIINPKRFSRGKAGVDGAFHLDHIVPKRFCFENNIPPELCAHYSNLQMISWRENVGSRNHIKGTIPPIFFKYVSSNSKIEQYVKLLKQIFPNGESFVTINDIVVTFYERTLNRAIVIIPIDGTHANLKIGHLTREALMKTQIPFIILFEDETNDLSLLSAKLKHYTQTNQSVLRIHARKCDIRTVTNHEKRILLETNHVQGNDNAHVSYGAYYNNQLVAVMTFSKPRVALGQKGLKQTQVGVWELSRFCTDVNYRIPGIASKLLTHFQRNYTWTEIYSYADKRWSTGNLYEKLGFNLVVNNPPDYFYVINGVRKHRWNYRKDILKNTLPNYDASLTEYQNMTNHGFHRVWDCGTLKFSMKNNKLISNQ